MESFARNFSEQNDVPVIGLRYFNVYGPGEQHKGKRASMVSQIVSAAEKGKSIKLFKYGEQARDWVLGDQRRCPGCQRPPCRERRHG
jgi:ADP-L-glycero-D-manno-heptose 6-epimerase